jgi:hypothetical protein
VTLLILKQIVHSRMSKTNMRIRIASYRVKRGSNTVRMILMKYDLTELSPLILSKTVEMRRVKMPN